MKIDICTDIMYNGLSFSEKVSKIKENGFDAVEFWSWSDKDISEVEKATENMEVVCFCIDSSDKCVTDKIGRYMLTSTHKEALKTATIESVKIARRLGAKSLIAQIGDKLDDVPYDEQIGNVINSINYIKGIFEENDMTLLVEPINLKERGNYLIPNAKTAIEIIKQINSPNVKVLYDIYHQGMENDFNIDEMIAELLYIGHIHIADVPNRSEPGTGQIDYKAVFKKLEEAGYSGNIGGEFSPQEDEEKAFNTLNLYYKERLL